MVIIVSYSELLFKYGEISFQEYVSEGISRPVFYGDIFYKLRRIKCEANFVSSGSKIVKRLRRRKYDQVIIERTIGLMLGSSTSLYRFFLKHCTLINKAVRTICRDSSKRTQRRQCPDHCPLWLLVGTPLVLGPKLTSRRASIAYSGGCLYIFWYTVLSPHILCFCLLLVLGLHKENYLHFILNMCPFDYTAFAVSGKV